MLVALAALIGATVLGVLQYWMLAGAVLVGGVVFSAMTWAVCSRALAGARLATVERLAAARPELRTRFASHLHDEVRNLYDSFTQFLLPTREKLAEQEARQTALQTQLHAMEQSFHTLDRELGSLLTETDR